MEEGSWKEREGLVMLYSTLPTIPGVFLDDSCSPVLRQNQQVLPKHVTDPTEGQVLRFGAGRSTRESSGKRADLARNSLDGGAGRAGEAVSKLRMRHPVPLTQP